MEVQRQAEGVRDLPIGIEAQRVERILLLVALLLETVVLLSAGHLMDVDRRSNLRIVSVENDVVEAAVALHPDRLFAAVFGNLLLGHRVVESQGQSVSRRELHDGLSIDTLALQIGERIANILRNAVELAWGRCILNQSGRADRAVCAGFPAAD